MVLGDYLYLFSLVHVLASAHSSPETGAANTRLPAF
jgi:hypothetical protein